MRYIYRGLSVQPPHQRPVAGTLKMPLFRAYDLQTGSGERASYRFGDGTTVEMNQRTDAVLSSAHVTYVKQGEVAQYVTPGTIHRVVTAAALAASIGTAYDVKVAGTAATFVVLHGSLRVANAAGSVVIERN